MSVRVYFKKLFVPNCTMVVEHPTSILLLLYVIDRMDLIEGLLGWGRFNGG